MRRVHILSLILTLGTPALCWAEGTQGSSPTQPRFRRPAPKEIKHQVLYSAPADLKIPLPPDAKFVAGYRSQYTTTRLITEFRFQTAYSAAAISDWYQKSLASTGWTVSQEKSGTINSLAANKPGLACSLNFMSSAPTIVLVNCSEKQ